MELEATMIPMTEVKVGDRRVGGIVEAIRYSKSGKTVYMTMRSLNRPGEVSEWPGEPACCNAAVCTEA